uniref:Replication factor A C-terminal domain-containing protein n=1 Tax=Brassica oleracea var. oleracea TaxID=109376 RepID=A0A0D3A1D5_BRAOL
MSKETAIRTSESSHPLLFRQVSPGPGDSTMQFRLLHFWDAHKNVKGGPWILLGIEMLMIDAEGTLAQGFIGQNRRNQYEKELQRGRIYTLTNFYASNNKVMYNVADQRLVICISQASALSKVEEDIEGILTERFRDEAAESFRLKFDASAATPTVLLVTTSNPKRLGGKLCLSSMSSSRVFFDEEVDPTKEYLAWLTTNPSVTSLVNPVEVVKAETLTISEIGAFLKHQPAQVAYFGFIATIDDVKLGTEWYYIACKDCQTKLNRGPTTLLCPKCGNENATAVANYRVELSVYDNDEQCTFIILGDAGKDLTWRKATELIDAYVQTKKFRIKVANYNFTPIRLSLTATKIVSPAELPPKNPPLKTLPGTEVENTELAASSGGGASAIDVQKKAKRAKRSD